MKNTSTESTPSESSSSTESTTTGTAVAPVAPGQAPSPASDPTPVPLESGYITFSGPGEGGEFRDPDGGYRIHLTRDIPVAFGGEARVTAAYAHKLVQDGQANYCSAPTN